MKTIHIMVITALALVTGCQMMTTAEKRETVFKPIERVAIVPEGSKAVVYTVGYEKDTGGYFMRARSPLFAAETMKGLNLDIGEGANHVAFGFDAYGRDLSTNAVAMVDILAKAVSDVTAKVCAAIVSHGGTAATDAVSSLVKRFVRAGGDASKAKVECKDGSCTVSDGTTTCTDGGCYVGGDCVDCTTGL